MHFGTAYVVTHVLLLLLFRLVLDPELSEHWTRDGPGGPPAVCAGEQSDRGGAQTPSCHQSIQVVGYSPDSVDVALLWTRSDDLGEGFHYIRSVSHIGFVLDASEGGPESGGAHDGTSVILFSAHAGVNQKWKVLPFH